MEGGSVKAGPGPPAAAESCPLPAELRSPASSAPRPASVRPALPRRSPDCLHLVLGPDRVPCASLAYLTAALSPCLGPGNPPLCSGCAQAHFPVQPTLRLSGIQLQAGLGTPSDWNGRGPTAVVTALP